VFLKKIKKGISDFGITIYFVHVIKRLLLFATNKISVQFVYLYAVPVAYDRKIKLPASLRKFYSVVQLHQDDEMLRSLPVTPQTIAYRFQQNALCLVILKKDEPIGFFWLIQDVYREDTMFWDIHMRPESAWDFALWVHEEHRLSPAFLILWEAALDYLGKRGVQWIYSRIGTTNSLSLQVHTKLGGRILSRLLFFRIGSLELCWDMGQRKLSVHTPSNRKIMQL
jgi:hypothetical protein